jgi:hypothetical protein
VGTWIWRAVDVHSTAVVKALAFLRAQEFARQIRADTFCAIDRSMGPLQKELAHAG